MKHFIRQSSTVFFSSLIRFACFAAAGIIIVRSLGPRGTGALYAALAAIEIIMVIAEGGVSTSLIHFFKSKKYSDSDLLSSLFFLLLILSSIGLCVLLFTDTVFPLLEDIPEALLFFALMIPFRLLTAFGMGWILAGGRINDYSRLNFIPSLVYLISLLACLSISSGIMSVLIAMFLAAFFSAFLLLFYLRKDIAGVKLRYQKPLMYKLLSHGLLYVLFFLLLKLQYRSDILVLKHYKGELVTGFYTLALGIGEQLWLLPQALFVVFLSANSQEVFMRGQKANKESPKQKDQNNRNIAQQSMARFRLSFTIIALAGIIAAVFAQWFIPLIFGKEFMPSILLFRLLLPGIVCFSLFKMLSAFFVHSGKPELLIKAFLPAVILNISLNILLIPHFGAWIAAASSSITYTLSSYLSARYYCQIQNCSLGGLCLLKHSDIQWIMRGIRKNR